MKVATFPSKIANLSFSPGCFTLLFRSPATFPPPGLSSSIRTPWKLTKGRRGIEGLMSKSLSSSLSNSFSSQPESESVQVQLPSPKPKSPPPQFPWLIVGLGNPGKKYQGTRHNVGFEMVEALADAERISMNTINFKALFGKGVIGDTTIMLAKPQTFMNASGESVGQIVSFYKIPIKQVLVIYDDLDLPFGKLRLLPKGGHGGHNGMRSIIDRLKGNREFPRLRIGIGRPPGKMDTSNFVLRQFNRQEQDELDYTFQTGVEAIRILLVEGFDKSATFVNTQKSMEQLG